MPRQFLVGLRRESTKKSEAVFIGMGVSKRLNRGLLQAETVKSSFRHSFGHGPVDMKRCLVFFGEACLTTFGVVALSRFWPFLMDVSSGTAMFSHEGSEVVIGFSVTS